MLAALVTAALVAIVAIAFRAPLDAGSRQYAEAARLNAQAGLEAQRQANWESRSAYTASFWLVADQSPGAWAALVAVLAVVALGGWIVAALQYRDRRDHPGAPRAPGLP